MVRMLGIVSCCLGACGPATIRSALRPAGASSAAARSAPSPRPPPRLSGSAATASPTASPAEVRVWQGYLDSLELLLRQPLERQRGLVILEARARLAANLGQLVQTAVSLPETLRRRARQTLARLDQLFGRVAHRQPRPEPAPRHPEPPPDQLRPRSALAAVAPPEAAAPAARAAADPEPDADISEAELDDGGPPVDIILPPQRPRGALRWPLSHVRITSSFGYRRDPISKRTGFHDGLDLSAPRGTVVQAAAAGRVTWAARRGGGGNVVVLLHGPGVKTVYAHLDQFLVTRGDTVAAGQPVGLVGSTGRSTGPHLHFVVRVGGRPINPLSVVGRLHPALAAR